MRAIAASQACGFSLDWEVDQRIEVRNRKSQKRHKVHRNQPEIAKKIVAFQVLITLQINRKTAREAANILEVPRSTMRSWVAKGASEHLSKELADFFGTPCGSALLGRIVLAVYHVTHFGTGGIRSLQQFLECSQLNQFVASSEGALQNFSVRYEEQVIAFGNEQEAKLTKTMKERKITAALDELYRGRRPCLVAIDIVSGFILLEKFTEDRTKETWGKELTPRLSQLNVSLEQVSSDLCGGIRAFTNEVGAVHSPDLFHAQQEISKATAAPLASQERAFEKALDKEEKKVQKAEKKFGVDSKEAEEAKLVLCNKSFKWNFERESSRDSTIAKGAISS